MKVSQPRTNFLFIYFYTDNTHCLINNTICFFFHLQREDICSWMLGLAEKLVNTRASGNYTQGSLLIKHLSMAVPPQVTGYANV